MRIAWFSPLPPVRSGIATVNAALLGRLDAELAIDRFVERRLPGDDPRVSDAHDFVWKHQRAPYDLVAYQVGNAACHDYMWAYLARYPGLVVLHDPRLHHARARQLLRAGRFDDYRHEFWYDHPDAVPDFVEYAVEGLGGPIYYAWSMLRVLIRTARLVAVHNARVAADLREQFPGARIDTVRLGTAALTATDGGRERVRAALGVGAGSTLFAAFGTITAEKRIGAIVRGLAALAGEQRDVHLLLAGDASGYTALEPSLASLSQTGRVHVTGYLDDDAIADHLAAADVCLCLRWPTALETSASWLQCLAAAKPTVTSDLAHLVDVPTLDPRGRRGTRTGVAPVAIAIDLLDEDGSLQAAMRALDSDRRLRDDLARAGHAHWAAHHTLDGMADDYRILIQAAASRPAPLVPDLPGHFVDDYSRHADELMAPFGLTLDRILGSPISNP